MKAVLESGTATACVETIADFIYGDGFTDEALASVPVNGKETLADLAMKVCRDFALFRGFSVNVRHNKAGIPYKAEHIPFQNIRKGRRQSEDSLPLFYFRQDWAKQVSKDNKEYLYTPYNAESTPAMIVNELSQVGEDKYFGQLMYYYIHSPGAETYPIPRGYSEMNLIKAEAEFSSYQYHNIANNFLFSSVLFLDGMNPNAPYGDAKEGKTAGQVLEEKLSEGKGSKKAGGMLVMYSKGELKEFPNSTTPEMFTAVQDLITDKITRAFGVPGILANIQTAGKLGQAQEFVNATQYFQNNLINVLQRKVEEKLNELFSDFPGIKGRKIEFKNKKILQYIPDYVYSRMSDKQLFELFDIPYEQDATVIQGQTNV